MLTLTVRKKDVTVLGRSIMVVNDIQSMKARVSFDAPKDDKIWRMDVVRAKLVESGYEFVGESIYTKELMYRRPGGKTKDDIINIVEATKEMLAKEFTVAG